MNNQSSFRTQPLWKSRGLWICIVLLAIVLVVCLYQAGVWKLPSCTNELASKKQSAEKPVVTKTIKIKLHPCRWSDMISIAELRPQEVPSDAHFQFQVNAPDWHEYWFWNGQKVRVEKTSTEWLGKISDSTFRLRGGEGEATICIQYFFR